jgi:hypothetical protein
LRFFCGILSIPDFDLIAGCCEALVKAAQVRRIPKRLGVHHTPEQRDSVVECGAPVPLSTPF